MSHPSVLGFENSLNPSMSFSLILIIAREPNNTTKSDGTLGTYPFELFPRCAMWNLPHSLMGTLHGLPPGEFRRTCFAKGISPFVFTDALPIGLPQVAAKKWENRKKILEEDNLEQAKTILGIVNSRFQDRLKLIIFTGLQHEMFFHFKEFIKNGITIPSVEVPFFYGTNMPEIREMFQTETEGGVILREVYNEFEKVKSIHYPHYD